MKTLTLPPADFSSAARAGRFNVTADQLPLFAEAARAAGCCVRFIDLDGACDKAALLRRFATALDFPPWFGHNWDALDDCLTDLDWLPAGMAYVLCLSAAPDDQDACATLYEVLDQAIDTWRTRGRAMWVLIGNDGLDA